MTNRHETDAHNHGKTFTIIVDLVEHKVTGEKISYQQVAHLAYPSDPVSPEITYTITYSIPHGLEGELRVGESIKLHERMTFNVGKSNRS